MAYISEGDALTADLIEKLQADMVSIDTATNPAVKKINSRFSKSKKYCLETTYTKITPAINDLNETQKKLTSSLTQTVDSVALVMGNTTEDPELKTRFEECVTALSTITDVTVLNSVMDILQRLSVVEKFSTDDFEDEFEIGETDTKSVFTLTHKPIGKVRFYIDGVRYFSNYYQYNPDDNTVVWLGTVSNMGNDKGFDISDSTVVIEYDYDKAAEEADKVTDEPAA